MNLWFNFLKGKILLLLFLFFFSFSSHAWASSLTYGYDLFDSKDSKNSHHQISLSDGYCIFSYDVFDRICFEMSGSFRLPQFKFDLSPQIIFHIVYLQQPIYGWHFTIGNVFTLAPDFRFGGKIGVGFYLYFVSLGVEYQGVWDLRGEYENRLFLQIGLVIPTGSINFLVGNQGL